MTPCSVVVGYRRFRGPCYLHLQVFEVEVFLVVTLCSIVVGYRRFRAWTSETLVFYHSIKRRHNLDSKFLGMFVRYVSADLLITSTGF